MAKDEVTIAFIPHSYAGYLKKQPIDELYKKLQTHLFTANWYCNGRKTIIRDNGCLGYSGDEYHQSHSFEKGIECLETVNQILNELRIRREIE